MSTIPPKCFCGMPIGHIYSVIKLHKDNSNPMCIGDILDLYGFRKTCCRTMLLSITDDYEDISKNKIESHIKQ
jgi:DNA-directed RNA polymerase subunit N (RpoN/RPB10)